MHFDSLIRIAAAVIAACGLSLVVVSVNAHGDHTQVGVSSFLRTQSQVVPKQRSSEWMQEGGGLELVDMYQCMCGGVNGDISGWIGLWLLTLLVGGVPTAVIVRSNRRAP